MAYVEEVRLNNALDGEWLPRWKKGFSLDASYTRLEDLLASVTSLGPQHNVNCNKIKVSIRLQTQQTRTYLGVWTEEKCCHLWDCSEV